MMAEISTVQNIDHAKPAERWEANHELSPHTAAWMFWSIVLGFAAIWVILPSVFHTGYRNDVIEIFTVGREWVWGNGKHPALTAWLAEIMLMITNGAFCTPFLVAQLCTIVTVWSIWRLARTVLSEKFALIAALSMLPQRLLTNESVLYNHNLVLLACYALIIYLVFQAFQTNQWRYWIGAGLAIGVGMHNKYPMVFLVFTILLYMSLRPAGRKHWFGFGPYLTAGIATLVFLPHIAWLFLNDFSTFGYASSRATSAEWWFHIVAPLKFAASQPLYWIPTLVVLFPVLGWVWTWKPNSLEIEKNKECERFLFYCCLVPILIHIAISAYGLDLRMVYGAPFWTFLGLWLLLRFQGNDRPNLIPKTILSLVAVECVVILGFVISFQSGKQPQPVYLPMKTLSKECERIWDERKFTMPCPYVTGDMILAGHAAHWMSNRPSAHVGATTWSTDEDVNQAGGIVIWPSMNDSDNAEVPTWVFERFPKAEVLPDVLELPYRKPRASHPPVQVGIAVVPPSQQQ